MGFLIIDIQGYKLADGRFVGKEVAAYSRRCDSTFLVCLKEPFSYEKLSDEDKKRVRWLQKNYHGIKWDKGDQTLAYVGRIIQKELTQNTGRIYVKGEEKKKWLIRKIGVDGENIINLDDSSCINLKMLKARFPISGCGEHIGCCVLQNVRPLLYFILSQKDI